MTVFPTGKLWIERLRMRKFLAEKDFILQLIRLGIGHDSPEGLSIPEQVNWKSIKSFSRKHGLAAIISDGIDILVENNPESMPPESFMTWLAEEVLKHYDCRYEFYKRSLADLASFYQQHGFKMMVLKGYVCSLDWPVPSHRPCGDMDIWLFGKYKEADRVLEKEKGIKVDKSRHHHTVFSWRSYVVENHFDFLNLHHHKSNVELEKTLKELGQDDSHTLDIYGQKVYIPSTDLHALFLIRHASTHFAAREMSLRVLLDWGFFVKAHTHEIDWQWLESVIDRFGMNVIYRAFNAVCVEDFGFDASIFPAIQCDQDIRERVINEIVSPEFYEKEPKNLFLRLSFKIRRWRANRWKHEMCYKEGMRSALGFIVIGHLLKPKSI